jgi:hypothetical protein
VDTAARKGEDPLPQTLKHVKLGYFDDEGFSIVHGDAEDDEAAEKDNRHHGLSTSRTSVSDTLDRRDRSRVQRKPVPDVQTTWYHSVSD